LCWGCGAGSIADAGLLQDLPSLLRHALHDVSHDPCGPVGPRPTLGSSRPPDRVGCGATPRGSSSTIRGFARAAFRG